MHKHNLIELQDFICQIEIINQNQKLEKKNH